MTLHNIPPFCPENARILILGSFPSVKSRETGFFYGHKSNRFWKVVSSLFGEDEPLTVPEKKQLLAKHGIALWDVIGACEIVGSADSSIKNAVPNEVAKLVEKSGIKKIFLNGKTAEKYYNKYIVSEIEAVCLPSTSPANAAFSTEDLKGYWKKITEV